MKNTTTVNMEQLYEQINSALESYPQSILKRPADSRWLLTFCQPFAYGIKRFAVEISVNQLSRDQAKAYGGSYVEGMPVIWLQTYVYDENGCHGWYNPQTMVVQRNYKNGSRLELTTNFTNLSEATADNACQLLQNIEAMALSDTKSIRGADEYIDKLL